MGNKKLSKQELDKRFDLIKFYKWQFLRRNEKYIQACEKWSGRLRHQWDSNEIIIGYPFDGVHEDFNQSTFGQVHNPKIKEYCDLYWGELQGLNADLISNIESDSKENNKTYFPKHGSWYPFGIHWEINMPLSPNVETIPHFVDIAPKEAILYPLTMEFKNNKYTNDIYLEYGATSLIEVNWAYPKTHLMRIFERLLDANQGYIKFKDKSKVDTRARFDKFDYYLNIWDMRYKDKLSVKEIAERISKDDPKGKYDSDIARALNSCLKLVDGGYKKIDYFQ